MWLFLQANWHKILIVIIAGAHAWKFFYNYIRPVAHKETQPMVIQLPKEGVTITIKPLE